MTLNDWMTKTGTTAGEIADFVGCDRSWISHLRNGRALPSLKTMDLIAVFTDGQVDRASWPSTVSPAALSPDQPVQPAGAKPA